MGLSGLRRSKPQTIVMSNFSSANSLIMLAAHRVGPVNDLTNLAITFAGVACRTRHGNQSKTKSLYRRLFDLLLDSSYPREQSKWVVLDALS